MKYKLKLNKFVARYIPKLLNEYQLARRVNNLMQLLYKFDADPENFLNRIVVGVEA